VEEGASVQRVESRGEASLDPEKLRKMYRDMLLGRLVDERMWVLNRAGKAPFVISGRGQEATQVGYVAALRPDDVMLPYYRDVAAVIARGFSARDVFLGLFAKAEDPSSGGRQMPSHFGCRRLNIITNSSPVVDHTLHAVGIAYAARLKGEDIVAVPTFGEGSTASGDFHEALNWAAIHRLAVVFVCENNHYAISVPEEKEMPVPSVAQRAAGYGIPGVTVDGNDVVAVYEAMTTAVARARRGEGPTLLECRTYRLVPHSSDDDDRTYRSAEEVESWRARDPIVRLRERLLRQGLMTVEEDEALRAELAAEVERATEEAWAAPDPRPEDTVKHVYKEEA
jgi:2-oxoisovalerate dehydrogenase E1 component alpha subunit